VAASDAEAFSRLSLEGKMEARSDLRA